MSKLPHDLDGWRLVKPTMSDEAQERVTAVCGGNWWRGRIGAVSGGGPLASESLFTVVPDPSRYRGPDGAEITLHFDSSGTLREPNPVWERIVGRSDAVS